MINEAALGIPQRRYWLVLLLMVGVQALVSGGNLGFAALGPFMLAELGLTNTQMALIPGVYFSASLLTSIPAGELADRSTEWPLLVIGPLTMGAALFLSAYAGSFPGVLALFALAGLASGAVAPMTVRTVATWSPRRNRAFALGLLKAGVSIGGVLTALVLPALAATAGWRQAWQVMGAGLGLLALVVLLVYGALARRRAAAPFRPAKGAAGRSPRPVWRRHLFGGWKSSLFWVSQYGFVAYHMAILTFLIPVLNTRAGLTPLAASAYLAAVQILAAVARPLLGLLSDRLWNGARSAVMLGCGALGALGGLLLVTLRPGGPLILVWIATGLLGLANGWIGVQGALLTEWKGMQHAGVMAGIGATLNQLSAMTGPLLFGFLADLFPGFRTSIVVLALGLLAATQALLVSGVGSAAHDA